MALPVANRVLIPAAFRDFDAIEQLLRAAGWFALPYADQVEAEAILARAPATAVLLPAYTGLPLQSLIESVRQLCPDAFLVGPGPAPAVGADFQMRAGCTPAELATALRVGAAMRDARAAERVLLEQLNHVEQQNQIQAERIRALEASCSSLQAWARSAQEQAVRDELTGLYNRRQFLHAAEAELERARRGESCFAIALADIDHFKHYNDRFGHVAGDDLLRHFARVLTKSLRRMDTVARFGGEEFIMLMPEVSPAAGQTFDPARLTERLREAVEQEPVLCEGGSPVTISAGVVRYPIDGKTIAELILEVDARLFRAKMGGRNRVCAGPA